MEPLNKSERKLGTWKFLGLFIGGILIVLIPFYFLIRLPAQEQQVNNGQITNMKGQLDFQKEFAVKMDSVMKMMEKYTLPDTENDNDKLRFDIGSILSDMGKLKGTESNGGTNIYASMLKVLLLLKTERETNFKNTESMDKLREEIADTKKELEKAKEIPESTLK